jgi:hypothetical protein
VSQLLADWIAATRERRGEDRPRAAGAPGLLDAPANPEARRAVAGALVALVGRRPARVTFEGGGSFANLARALVNLDGDVVSPPSGRERDTDQLLVGLAAHEGGHLLLSQSLPRPRSPLRRWLLNVIEDERVEVEVARRWPTLARALAYTRRELLACEAGTQEFLAALFHLVRAPEQLSPDLWSAYGPWLTRSIRILTPFPETVDGVVRAVRRLERIVPPEVRAGSIPEVHELVVVDGTDAPGHAGTDARLRRMLRRLRACRGLRADTLEPAEPPVEWVEAVPVPTAYHALAAAVQGDARTLRAALTTATRLERGAVGRTGILDRRRLHAWRFDDRLFRGVRAVPYEITLALLLDLSGSMHPHRATLQRIAVTISEAARGLPHVRLFVYGHAADGGDAPCTVITRFATPARGAVTTLGDLPRGANNRDGHALEIVARDLNARAPSPRTGRLALHVCDGDPQARGYRGRPAREATRRGIATFRQHFGPLVLVGIDPATGFETLGAPVLVWHADTFAPALARTLGAALATGG